MMPKMIDAELVKSTLLLMLLITCVASVKSANQNNSLVFNKALITDPTVPVFFDWVKYQATYYVKPLANKIKISCNANGSKPLTYRWVKDGKKFQRRPADPSLNTTKAQLEMKQLTQHDDGKYMCIVSNYFGSINRTFILHIVPGKSSRIPVLVRNHPRNTTVELGQNASMECFVVYSGTSPYISWYKWTKIPPNYPHQGNPIGFRSLSTKLKPVPNKFWVQIKPFLKDDISAILTIFNVTKEDLGLYTCCAANLLSEVCKSAILNSVDGSNPTSVVVGPSHTTSWKKGSYFAIIFTAVSFAFLFILFYVLYRRKILFKSNDHKNNELHLEDEETPYDDEQPLPLLSPFSTQTRTFYSNTSSATPLIRILSRESCCTGMTSTVDYRTIEGLPQLPFDEKWEIDREKITLQSTLGTGAFGVVRKAVIAGAQECNHDVAIKMLKDNATWNELKELWSEIDTMKSIGQHKNIINLLGTCTQDGPLFVVLEYAPHGSLRSFLRTKRSTQYYNIACSDFSKRQLTIRDFLSFSFQIALGMEHLSSRKCVHRDLAARNVLVGSDYVLKIADFGLSRYTQDYYKKMSDGRLPIKWLAIEALFDNVYTTQSDVWSFGVLLWEIFTLGNSPYPGISMEDIFELLKSGYRMQMPQDCPKDIYGIMLACWNKSPSDRPSFTELKAQFDAMLSSTVDNKAANQLTDAQREEIESAFKTFDKNGDGHITVEELGEAMKQAGQSVSENELQDMIKAADFNGNGKIEYKEFEQMMCAQLGAGQMSANDIKYYFEQFDKNGDGFITVDEMRCLVRTFHSNLTGEAFEQEVRSMIEVADTNKDGKISFEEFEKAVLKNE